MRLSGSAESDNKIWLSWSYTAFLRTYTHTHTEYINLPTATHLLFRWLITTYIIHFWAPGRSYIIRIHVFYFFKNAWVISRLRTKDNFFWSYVNSSVGNNHNTQVYYWMHGWNDDAEMLERAQSKWDFIIVQCRTGVLCPSSGDLSESELLVRSLRGLDSCLSFIGVLMRFCLGVWPPSNLVGKKGKKKKTKSNSWNKKFRIFQHSRLWGLIFPFIL